MQRSEKDLRIMHSFFGEGRGECEMQGTRIIFDDIRDDPAHAFKAVGTGGSENGNSCTHDVETLFCVIGMTFGRISGILILSIPVEHGTDHYALIAVISTLV